MSDPVCPVCAAREARRWGVQPRVTWWRCCGCGLFFVHPQPGDAILSELYDRVYYERAPAPGTREAERLARRWGERVQMIGATAGAGVALDVGCGHGEFLTAASRRGWSVWGMEVSPPALAHLPPPVRGRATVGRVEHAPFPERRFDLVMLFDVLEHVRDPVAFLRHARRLLTAGGQIVITTPNAGVWKARLWRHRWKYFDFERYLHLYLFTADAIEWTLAAAGMEVAHWIRPRNQPLFLSARDRAAT